MRVYIFELVESGVRKEQATAYHSPLALLRAAGLRLRDYHSDTSDAGVALEKALLRLASSALDLLIELEHGSGFRIDLEEDPALELSVWPVELELPRTLRLRGYEGNPTPGRGGATLTDVQGPLGLVQYLTACLRRGGHFLVEGLDWSYDHRTVARDEDVDPESI